MLLLASLGGPYSAEPSKHDHPENTESCILISVLNFSRPPGGKRRREVRDARWILHVFPNFIRRAIFPRLIEGHIN